MEQLFSGTENKSSSFKEKQKSALSSFEYNRWSSIISDGHTSRTIVRIAVESRSRQSKRNHDVQAAVPFIIGSDETTEKLDMVI